MQQAKKIDVNQFGFTEYKNKKLGFEDRVSGGARELARVCAGRASEAKKPSTQTKETKKLVQSQKN